MGGVGPGHIHHFLGDGGPLGGFIDPLFPLRGLAWMLRGSWLTWANTHRFTSDVPRRHEDSFEVAR